MSAVPLRSLVPRASLTLHAKQLQHRLIRPTTRSYATTPPPKPRVLEKPDKFRPPSHPARLRKPSPYRGPPLSQHERARQRTRRYPNMMPPEGSRLHWFLTSRYLHAGITMTILITLVLSLPLLDFLHTTPFTHLLPPNSLFLSHPLAFLSRYWEVYRMHTDHVSAETAERRRQKVEDVRKRSEFRKAHGMEGESGLGGWTSKSDSEVLGGGMREGGEFALPGPGRVVVGGEGRRGVDAQLGKVTEEGGGEETYVDFQGNRQTVDRRKKWLGIW